MSENQNLFALLIDGDNAQVALIPQILDALQEYGKPIIKKVYGDWSQDQLKNWKPIASKYNIDLEHHYTARKGKNATDIALVIDAMDNLKEWRGKVDGVCIVSSDSDFTLLARRIRKENLMVIGIGKGSETLEDAYDHFIPIENLQPPIDTPIIPETVAAEIPDSEFQKLLVKAYRQVIQSGSEENQGRASLHAVREVMKELDAVFAAEYKQMPKFVNKVKLLAEANPRITLEEQPDSKPVVHYVRIETTKSSTVIRRFREAYQHAALKSGDTGGWVTLSAIGSSLRELYPDYQPLMYDGVKHSQLKKVVEKMMEKHPNIIELDSKNKVLCLRIKT